MKRVMFGAAAAVLALGAAGYAMAGRPDLPAVPSVAMQAHPDVTPEAEQASKALLQNYGDVRAWLTLSDALIRAGRTETAVAAIEAALDAFPGDVNLWVQLGVALVAHAQGEMVPAARLAFDRASRLDPAHPAPPYFLGLAFLQAGQPEQALKVWESLAAGAPRDAPWQPMLERRMNAARMMIALGVGADTATAPGKDMP